MAITLPPTNDNGSLRPFTSDELLLIDLKRRGVKSDHTHMVDEMGPDGSRSTRKFSCSWEERYAAAILLTGYAKSYVEDDVVKISRLPPDYHPAFSNFNWLCTKVRLDPWRFTGEVDDDTGASQGSARFTRCDITATYEISPFVALDDAEVEEEFGEMKRYVTEPGYPGAGISVATDYIQLAGGSMRFASDDGTARPAKQPIPYPIGFPEAVTKKSAVWRRVPLDIWGPDKPLTQMVKGDGTSRGYIGALNLNEIWGHPPLTLKLEGVSERLLPDSNGFGYSWDIEYLFSEKNVPFGHTGLYFGENKKVGDGGVAPGYYQALNANQTSFSSRSASELAADDTLSLFQVRELKNLFVPAGA